MTLFVLKSGNCAPSTMPALSQLARQCSQLLKLNPLMKKKKTYRLILHSSAVLWVVSHNSTFVQKEAQLITVYIILSVAWARDRTAANVFQTDPRRPIMNGHRFSLELSAMLTNQQRAIALQSGTFKQKRSIRRRKATMIEKPKGI